MPDDVAPEQPAAEPTPLPYVVTYYFTQGAALSVPFHVKNGEIGWKDLHNSESKLFVFEFTAEDQKTVKQIPSTALYGIYFSEYQSSLSVLAEAKFHTLKLQSAQETSIPVFPSAPPPLGVPTPTPA